MSVRRATREHHRDRLPGDLLRDGVHGFEFDAAKSPPRGIARAEHQDIVDFTAIKHAVCVREVRERAAELIPLMRQKHAGDRDGQFARGGKIGQAETTGRILLPEVEILLGAGQRTPKL